MTIALFWRKLTTPGTDLAFAELTDDALRASGTAVSAEPVPHVCRYELRTLPGFGTESVQVWSEGAGWRRRLRLDRVAGAWRAEGEAFGDAPFAEAPGPVDPDELAEAVDVDIAATALTNILPIRRLKLHKASPGTAVTLPMAWILLPSLKVVLARQTYTVNTDGTINYRQGEFTADLTLDRDGFVRHYPGYATRVVPER
ncbi:hypothetical protein D5S17_13950 [Pseudonocardiaceae bacterium YIM PH 21723]|nr:hypothetical protein D5S17_13950 [Pseudonocardiaceae bacterium YIM PH 21723]